jgi:CBS domain containing-hemolysin-like protein
LGHNDFARPLFRFQFPEEEIMTALLLFGITTSLVLTCFFSVLETSFKATNKLQLEVEGRMGNLPAQLLTFFAKRPAWFTGTTFIGTTLSLVAFVTLMSLLLSPTLANILPERFNNGLVLVIIQTIISAFIILALASIIPKTAIISNHIQVLMFLVVPFAFSFVLLAVLTFPLLAISRFFVVNVLRSKDTSEIAPFEDTDLRPYTNTIGDTPVQPEDIELDKKIFHNALEFKTVKIRDCMIPRTEITSVELNESIEKLREAFVESGHSKVIIYKQSIDEIIGYCHSSALFKRPEEIKDILTPIIIVPETALANELMIRFINEHKSLAVVVDEFGGTAGLVSMEDVIEEIFGDIEDEHDDEDELVEQKLSENIYRLSARLEVDYLNETYQWQLPTGEYETLGGLILAHSQEFPKQGQIIEAPPFTFTVQDIRGNRLETVVVKVENQGKMLE